MEQLGVRPHAVGGVLRAELFNPACNLDGRCVQQLHAWVMLQACQRPQGVGNLLRGVLGQGLNSPVGCDVKDLPSWVIPQLCICPEAVGDSLKSHPPHSAYFVSQLSIR